MFSAGGHAVPAQNAETVTTAKHKPVPHAQTMIYEVYAGGINAVSAEVGVSESKDRYSLEVKAWTKGFLAKLAPWSGTFETKGWLQKNTEMPELHKSVALWRDEEEVKEYSYGKDGSFKKLTITEEGEDKSPEKIEDELTQGTIDALTATLRVMKKVTETGKCEGTAEVFDGDRRFELTYAHKEDEALLKTDYNVYEGPTAVCEVEVTPKGGKWHSKPRGWLSIQEQGRERGSLPTLWMASIDGKAPAIPVKIRVKTEYGTLFLHLIEYRNGSKIIKAATR